MLLPLQFEKLADGIAKKCGLRMNYMTVTREMFFSAVGTALPVNVNFTLY
jgi:hypothetical protein